MPHTGVVIKRDRHLFYQDFDLRQQGRLHIDILAPFNLPLIRPRHWTQDSRVWTIVVIISRQFASLSVPHLSGSIVELRAATLQER